MATVTTLTTAPARQTTDKVEIGAPSVALRPSEADERRAEEYEKRVANQMREQLQRLKDEARTLYGMVEGRPGVIGPHQWAKLLDKAGDEIGNGRFIVRYLGAERYLDAATVAVLITLRQNLIAELGRSSTVELMAIDTAVVAYYNFLRVQRWIGDLSIVFEQQLFGGEPLSLVHGQMVGERLGEKIEHLSNVMLPLQERTQRMMLRALDRLPKTKRDV